MLIKRVEETYEQGEYVCEWVDEMMPLGEDRKSMIVPIPAVDSLVSQIEENVSDEKLVLQLRNAIDELRGGMFLLPSMIINALVARHGDEVWEEIKKIMYDVGHQRAEELIDTMKIDPKDARSVGRIFDLEDSQNGVKGEWIETGERRAVKHEYFCPFANAAMLCPEVCTHLVDSIERGTLDGMGVTGNLTLGKLLSKGDPYCEVILELED